MARRLGRVALAAGAILLAGGAPVGGARSATYPTTAAFTASDAPDLWTATGGGSAVAIALGGTVTFEASTVESHDASFDSAAVACSSGGDATGSRVPAAPSASWNGTCAFSAPGYYALACTLHAGMAGEVAVAGADGVLPPRTPQPPPPPPEVAPPGGGAPAPGGTQTAAAARPVFDIAREQRGSVVRGAIALAGPATTATIEISARRRDLAANAATRAGQVRLRRLTRTTNAAGQASFTIALSPIVRRAVLRHRRLALSVRVSLRGPRIGPAGATRAQRVTLLAPGVRMTALPRATVEVRNDFFLPRNVTLRRGATVTWTWRSEGRPHNVAGLGAKSPDQPAGTYRRTFRRAGSFTYACSLHDGMTGTVSVR